MKPALICNECILIGRIRPKPTIIRLQLPEVDSGRHRGFRGKHVSRPSQPLSRTACWAAVMKLRIAGHDRTCLIKRFLLSQSFHAVNGDIQIEKSRKNTTERYDLNKTRLTKQINLQDVSHPQFVVQIRPIFSIGKVSVQPQINPHGWQSHLFAGFVKECDSCCIFCLIADFVDGGNLLQWWHPSAFKLFLCFKKRINVVIEYSQSVGRDHYSVLRTRKSNFNECCPNI